MTKKYCSQPLPSHKVCMQRGTWGGSEPLLTGLLKITVGSSVLRVQTGMLTNIKTRLGNASARP